MKRIIIGNLYLLDQENTINSDISIAPIVKVIEKRGLGSYLVQDVDYSGKDCSYIVHKSQLTPIKESNIILRFPISMPIINEYDMAAIKNILLNYTEGKKQTANDMKRLEMIYLKAVHLANVFGIDK